MSHFIHRRSLALFALLAMPGPETASATVSNVTYGKSYAAGSEVAVFRRRTNEMVIRGSLLDLHTDLEVRRNGSLVSDPSVTLVSKHGGDDVRITVRITGDSNTPLGACELWIRYAIEASGPDKVKLRVYDRGVPEGGSVSPLIPKVGETMRVTFTGTGLANARFKITDFPGLNRRFEEQDRSETKYSFTCEPIFPGSYPLNGNNLVDRNLPLDLRSLEQASYVAQPVGGRVDPNPIVTSVSRPVATVGQPLRLGGHNLSGNDPELFRTRVLYMLYSPTIFDTTTLEATVTSANTGSVEITVPDNIVPGTVRVVLEDQRIGRRFGALTPLFFVAPTRPPQNLSGSKLSPDGESSVLTTVPIPFESGLNRHILNARDTLRLVSEFTNVPLNELSVTWAGQPMTPVLHRYGNSRNITLCAPLERTTILVGKIRIANGTPTKSPIVFSGIGSKPATSGPGPTFSDEDFAYVPAPSNAAFVTATGTVTVGGTIKVSATNAFVGVLGVTLRPRFVFTDAAGTRRAIEAFEVTTGTALFTVPAGVASGPIRLAGFEHYGGVVGVQGAMSITP